MNRRTFLWVLLPLLAAVGGPAAANAGEVVLTSEKQMEFARHYMDREEYDRAAQELERLAYFFPDDPRVPEARYTTGWCYLKLRRYERARKILWEVYEAYCPASPCEKALYLIGESYRLQGELREAASYFERVASAYPETEAADEARFRMGMALMEAGRWEDASSTFQGMREDSRLKEPSVLMAEQALDGLSLPRRSPAAAGIMAGVLPGLGHAYCGRYHEGAVSLLINGAFAWAAFEAFDSDQDVLGGILGFMGLGFYTGNIYSAVNCARRHNESVKRGFLESLPGRLGVYATGKDLGLGLHFRF
jgi:tetratricopeptide (TPR) repeat protein